MFFFLYIIQIVTTLNLSNNAIKNKGGRMIAYILSHNNVWLIIQSYQCVIFYFEILLTINLQNNRMEDVVAKRFAKVLERNTVRLKYYDDLSFQYWI